MLKMKKITPTISVIMPCLNEEISVGRCVEEAVKSLTSPRFFKVLKIKNTNIEVIVVDNGSSDKSREIAKKMGAKVIIEEKKGYGNALLRGIKEAKGNIIVMGEAMGVMIFLKSIGLLSHFFFNHSFLILLWVRG